jgi:sugar lactone lactonase YvrE
MARRPILNGRRRWRVPVRRKRFSPVRVPTHPDSPPVWLVCDAKCRTAESPVWDDETRRVLFSDVQRGRIIAVGVDDGAVEIFTLPEPVSSFGLCESGRLVVAFPRGIALYDSRTGDIERLTAELDEPPGNRFNDGKVGPDGCFWVGTRDEGRYKRQPSEGGGLYRVTPDGELACVERGYAASNGLAWSPDGATMYHSDSYEGCIDVWDFEPATGKVANRRPFARLDEDQGRPDGGACDADGYYWSAGVSAGCLNRFSPTGELVGKLELPCPAPTMPCFADNTLYVTSLKRNALVGDERFPVNIGGLFRIDIERAGAGVLKFRDQ